MLIPGGFGIRGVEGKVAAVRYARERGVPFLGICLGLQCAVIEFARNVMGLDGANSSEFDPATPHAVIDLLPEQKDVTDLGGSMRLGAQPCHLVPGTRAAEAYGEPVVDERHRHRWEVNPAYHERLEQAGLVLSGNSHNGRLTEIIELPDHPFFVAGQFHPELRSRPTRPHPLFRDFVGAAQAHRRTPRRAVAVDHRLGHAVPEPLSARTAYEGRYVRVDLEDWPGLEPWEIVRRHDATAVLPRHARRSRACWCGSSARPCARSMTEVPAGILDVDGRGRAHRRRPRALRGDRLPPHARSSSSAASTRRSARATSTCTCSGRAPTPSRRGRSSRASSSCSEPLGRMVDAARSGRVRDAKTALALLMASGRPPLPRGATARP